MACSVAYLAETFHGNFNEKAIPPISMVIGLVSFGRNPFGACGTLQCPVLTENGPKCTPNGGPGPGCMGAVPDALP